MPMEAAAMDKLVDKGEFRPHVAQAIAEAIGITIKAANLVTVPMLDARFAALETKMEIRFSSIEKSIEATKVWATLLYAGLTIALFSALAVDHHWLVSREDQLVSQMWARSDASMGEQQTLLDKRIAEERTRSDEHFAERQASIDKRFAEEQSRSDKRFAEQDENNRALFAEQQRRTGALVAQHEARYHQLLQQSEARIDTKLDELRKLIIAASNRTAVTQPSPTDASRPQQGHATQP